MFIPIVFVIFFLIFNMKTGSIIFPIIIIMWHVAPASLQIHFYAYDMITSQSYQDPQDPFMKRSYELNSTTRCTRSFFVFFLPWLPLVMINTLLIAKLFPIIPYQWLFLLKPLSCCIISIRKYTIQMNKLNQSSYFEGDFADEVIMAPIQLKTTFIRPGTKFHKNQRIHLGIYDTIKMSNLLDPARYHKGHLVQIVDIDEIFHITTVSEEFNELMARYIQSSLCFVGVVGNHRSGKSFFVDKIYNLAEVLSNNFCSHPKKGIFTWSQPFIKDDLRIFIIEAGGFDMQSPQFQALMIYLQLMCSIIINIRGVDQNNRSTKQYDSCVGKILTGSLPNYFPKYFFQLYRPDQDNSILDTKHINVFKSILLQNAASKDYKGNPQGLYACSFLMSNVVNEEYVRRVKSIFNQVLQVAEQKKYKEISFNGMIAMKVVKSIQDNSNRKNKIQKIYDDVVQQLYKAAYDYCVVTYHQSLGQALSDQLPKSITAIFDIFGISSRQIMSKYQSLTLDLKLHILYEQKLLKHMDEQERLLLYTNAQKTKIALQKSIGQDQDMENIQMEEYIQKLKYTLPHLDHERANIIGKKLQQVFKALANNNKYLQSRQIKQLQKEILEYEKIIQQNETKAQQCLEFQQRISRYQSQLSNMSQGNSDGLKILTQNIQRFQVALKDKSTLSQNLKKEHQEKMQTQKNKFNDKMKKIKNRQKQLEKQIQQINSSRQNIQGSKIKQKQKQKK